MIALVSARGAGEQRVTMRPAGRKWCNHCRKFKPLSAFQKHSKERDDRLAAYCTRCKSKMNAEAIVRRRGENDPTLAARWSAKVDMGPHPRGCWIWTGATKLGGRTWTHGVLCQNGNYNAVAHRIGFTLLTGYPLERNERLNNLCGTGGLCVRYDHWDFPDSHRPALATKGAKATRRRRDDRILGQVEGAIPAHLPEDVRNEMRQELVIEALTGRSVHKNRVTPQKVKRALRAAWAAQVDPYQLSIDTPISDDGDSLTHRDVIEDNSIFSDPVAMCEASRAFKDATP